jgi:hypothetical protein
MNGGASQSMMGVFVNGNHQYYIKNGNTNWCASLTPAGIT